MTTVFYAIESFLSFFFSSSSATLICFNLRVAILFFLIGDSSLPRFLLFCLSNLGLGTSCFLGLALRFKFFFKSIISASEKPNCTVSLLFFCSFFFDRVFGEIASAFRLGAFLLFGGVSISCGLSLFAL